jgi:ferrous iron transport protein B
MDPVNSSHIHIALVGNPNSGKTSLFNALTGLHQKVGNFPGVTVDKKVGHCEITPDMSAVLIDLPGTYSLYPRREDEWVAYRVLMQQDKKIRPNMVVLVADASNLQRNLLFASQIIDLKMPVVIALTMLDLAKRKGIRVNMEELERSLGVPVVSINPRKNKGLPQLKRAIELTALNQYRIPSRNFIESAALASSAVNGVQEILPELSDYRAIHYLINHESFILPSDIQIKIEQVEQQHQFNHTRVQAEEIMQRYHRIKQVMQHAVSEPDPLQKKLFTEKLDDVLLHRRWGYLILVAVLFFLFQSIF